MERGKWLISLTMVAAALSVVFSLAQSNALKTSETHVGCYIGAWAFYRPGDGKFDVDDIDARLCTHIYYGFANLDNVTWEIYAYDPWYDLDNSDTDLGCVPDPQTCKFDSYRRFVALKEVNPRLTPMLSVGGWNAGSGAFSTMAADPAKRKTFVDSTIPFLLKFGFEGLDLDWEYPGDREGSDHENDKENFTPLIQELGSALHENGLLFSMAATPDPKRIVNAYDLDAVMPYFDWINVMCYDYSGMWNNFTGHNGPLFGRWEESFTGHPSKDFNVYDTIHYYLNHNVDPKKIVMGMPTYGRGFQLYDEKEHDLYCPAYDGAPKMPYTRQLGIWGYHEVLQCFYNTTITHPYLLEACPDCKAGEDNWEIVRDGCYKAPYIHQGPVWMSFDDVQSINLKARFVNTYGLLGGMIWSLETDDFHGLFDHQGSNQETYPLLREINKVLKSGETLDSSDQLGSANQNADCGGKFKAPMCDFWGTPTTTASPESTTTGDNSCIVNGVDCQYNDQLVVYPGNCHYYYHCLIDENGECTVEHFDCGDWVFDPNVGACIWMELPGEDELCMHNWID